MAEPAWLDGYAGQTTDELLALEGKYRTDSIVLAFEEALQQKEPAELNEEERVVLAVEALEREINNGGYDQFFCNTPEFAAAVVDALRRIGRPDVATITHRAIDTLGIDGPLTAGAVEKAADDENPDREETLEACDSEYYDTAGDLADPLLAFIKANRARIRLP